MVLSLPTLPPKTLGLEKSIRSTSEIVHITYDPETLEPVPSEEWTRFVCISDTHCRSFDVPDGDVLLHSGDLTNKGTVYEFQKTMGWLYSLPHKLKIIIAGNHDLTLDEDWYERNGEDRNWKVANQDVSLIRDMVKSHKATSSGIVYLQDEKYEFQARENGRMWSVYGSPWSPEFYDWAFNYRREDAHELLSKYPKVDILMTHGPSFGIFDQNTHGEDVGCEALAAHLRDSRPRLHVSGHIHEARGAYIHAWDPSLDFPLPRVQNAFSKLNHSAGDSYVLKIHNTNTEDNPANTTVFVNAANWPSARKGGMRSSFGGPGFQPVIVDLKE